MESDEDTGFKAAIERHFKGAAEQPPRSTTQEEPPRDGGHAKRKGLGEDLRAIFSSLPGAGA